MQSLFNVDIGRNRSQHFISRWFDYKDVAFNV
jgi:hypothetical protein